MDTTIAVTAVGLTAIGIGITIVVLLIRGSYLLGGVTNQVNNLGKQVGDIATEMQEQRAEFRQDMQRLREEFQQSLQEQRAEFRQDTQQQRAEFRQDMQQLREESRQDMQQLREEMNAGFDKLAVAVNDLREEVQQNNQMLAALANHTHDTDGRTVFTVPSVASR